MHLLHSLLDDPLIGVRQRGDDTPRHLSLPALFVALTEDLVRDFPALRPHQRHPWHAFLVQLAAMALHQAGVLEPFACEREWHAALMGLTPEHPDGAAWCLVSPIDRPAFLQAPVPEMTLDRWDEEPTPDAIDLLVTSKNHELKQQRIQTAAPDDWIFALVSLQTAGPFPGRGNYGVARMNGGSSSRPGLGISPIGGVGARWRRDLAIALSSRSAIADAFGYRPNGGIGLLWLMPWDGKTSLSFSALDPFFIEICRRIRLVDRHGRVRMMRTSSAAPRIPEGKSRKGNTGDLWTPISKSKASSLGVSEHGFDYRRICELAFGAAWQWPPAQRVLAGDDQNGLSLVARALAGGQSKTSGYHERRIPLPSRMRRLLMRGDTGLLERVAAERVAAVGRIHQQLRSALEVLFDKGRERAGGDRPPESIRDKAARYAKPFEQAEDLRFFGALSQEIEADAAQREAIRLQWLLSMAEHARSALVQAFEAGPRSGEQRYRARAAAKGRLEAGLHSDKVLPSLADYYRQQQRHRENSHESDGQLVES